MTNEFCDNYPLIYDEINTPQQSSEVVEIAPTLKPEEEQNQILKPFCLFTIANPTTLGKAEKAINEIMNRRYSIVMYGSKCLIAERTKDRSGNLAYNFIKHGDAMRFNENMQFNHVTIDAKGNEIIKKSSAFNVWLKSINRLSFNGVDFDPSEQLPRGMLNIWTGWKVAPKPVTVDINRILWHLEHIICAGNRENYQYLLSWLAHIVQKPNEKSGVCLAIRSTEKGTGKSTIAVIMNKLMGDHAITIQSQNQLTGQFNQHQANKLFVTLEEAVWHGDKQASNTMKTLITESSIVIEGKGRDSIIVPSYHRYMLLSNEYHFLAADDEERRYFALEASPAKVGDNEYFNSLYSDIDNHEIMGQLFQFLKTFDYTGVNLRKAPKTDALNDQIEQNKTTFEEWFDYVNELGYLSTLDDGRKIIDKGTRIKAAWIRESYTSWMRSKGLSVHGNPATALGRLLSDQGWSKIKTSGTIQWIVGEKGIS